MNERLELVPKVRACLAAIERAQQWHIRGLESASVIGILKVDLADAVVEAVVETFRLERIVGEALLAAYAPGAYGPEHDDTCFEIELARRGYYINRGRG